MELGFTLLAVIQSTHLGAPGQSALNQLLGKESQDSDLQKKKKYIFPSYFIPGPVELVIWAWMRCCDRNS